MDKSILQQFTKNKGNHIDSEALCVLPNRLDVVFTKESFACVQRYAKIVPDPSYFCEFLKGYKDVFGENLVNVKVLRAVISGLRQEFVTNVQDKHKETHLSTCWCDNCVYFESFALQEFHRLWKTGTATLDYYKDTVLSAYENLLVIQGGAHDTSNDMDEETDVQIISRFIDSSAKVNIDELETLPTSLQDIFVSEAKHCLTKYQAIVANTLYFKKFLEAYHKRLTYTD
jgi:hypothetical protein